MLKIIITIPNTVKNTFFDNYYDFDIDFHNIIVKAVADVNVNHKQNKPILWCGYKNKKIIAK